MANNAETYYPYEKKSRPSERMARATLLADVLEDCVNLYIAEIADDEPRETQQLARQMLARKLYQQGGK